MFGDKGAGAKAAGTANDFVQQGIDAIRPFFEAGRGQLDGLTAGATPEGLDATIRKLMGGDTFGGLAEERGRAVQGQLAAGGLTRSGTAMKAMAAVPTDLALMLEQMLTGRAQGLAGNGQSAAGGMASMFDKQGDNASSGELGDEKTKSNTGKSIMRIASGIFFSDPRLKTNIQRVGHLGDLGVYEWDWIEGAKDTVIGTFPTHGFMADEVEEKYPHHVSEFASWKVLAMPELLDELERKYVN